MGHTETIKFTRTFSGLKNKQEDDKKEQELQSRE